jgi:hypothetical protein
VGEGGPRRFGVRIWEGIFGEGISAGEAAREVELDMVGESGYVALGLAEKGFFLCVAVVGDSWCGKYPLVPLAASTRCNRFKIGAEHTPADLLVRSTECRLWGGFDSATRWQWVGFAFFQGCLVQRALYQHSG